jgi:acyl carrier protein
MKESGPYSLEELIKMAKSNLINKNYWMCTANSTDWKSVVSVPEIAAVLESETRQKNPASERIEAKVPMAMHKYTRKSTDTLFQKMKELIAEKLEIDDSRIITMDYSFRHDLGADSLDMYELAYTAEEEFGVPIPDELANNFETVRDAYNYILAKL